MADGWRRQSGRVLDTFRKWDKDGSKELSYLEFEKALSLLGVPNPADVKTLWYEFDVDGSGQVTYHEMLSVLQPSLAKVTISRPSPTTSLCAHARHVHAHAHVTC